MKFENRESSIEFEAAAVAAPFGAFCFGILRSDWGRWCWMVAKWEEVRELFSAV